MKVLVAFFLFTFLFLVEGQVQYVPVQIVIPSLNGSVVQALHNRADAVSHTGWDNPLLNKIEDSFNYTTSNHDLIVGRIRPMDHRLFKQVYWKPRKWWKGRVMLVRYPRDFRGNYGRHETISAIRVYNKFYDGLDSKAEIVAGGVWKRFVTIRLSSTLGKGFRFLVVIYGR